MIGYRAANARSLLTVALLMFTLCACTVIQLKKDVEKDETRIANKEEDLKTEEVRQGQLREEITQLQKDLTTRQVSLDELRSRLTKLQQTNAATPGTTKEQRVLQQQREINLKVHQGELAKIEQSGLSVEEKKKRLAHLKEEIRKSLNRLKYF